MRKIYLLIATFLFTANLVFCADFSVFKLDNGQNVIIQEVKNNPIVTIDTWVKTGSIIDYDGHGYLLDKYGERIDYMCCDVSFLEKAKENGACFVAWYNK